MSRRHEWSFPIPMTRLHAVLSDWFSNPILTTTASTFLATSAHADKQIVINKAAGCAVTLPAAAGTGDKFEFVIGTTISSNTSTIKVANASDTMVGYLVTSTTTGATTNGFSEAAGGTDDTITMNGTTTGGIVGSRVICTDIAKNVWLIEGRLIGSGTLATSLSATVS